MEGNFTLCIEIAIIFKLASDKDSLLDPTIVSLLNFLLSLSANVLIKSSFSKNSC